MNALLKLGIVAFYIAVGVDVFYPILGEYSLYAQYAVLILLVAHAGEAIIFRKQLAKYQGSFAMSVFYTLLFGFMHWQPLQKASAQA